MKWKYRIIQLFDGSYATQFAAKSFCRLLEAWSVPSKHESYLEAQAHCKRMIQSDREEEAIKRNKKPIKIVEIFE